MSKPRTRVPAPIAKPPRVNKPRNVVSELPAEDPPAAAAAEVAVAVDDPVVTVLIARDFILTLDDHVKVSYKAGIDEMPKSHAEHWWSKNHGGVEIYDR